MKQSEYNFSEKKVGIFFGLLFLAVSITTVLYGSIKGFDNFHDAVPGDIDFVDVAFTPSTAGQYICQFHGAAGTPYANAFGYPSCPACGQPMDYLTMASPSPLSTVAAGNA